MNRECNQSGIVHISLFAQTNMKKTIRNTCQVKTFKVFISVFKKIYKFGIFHTNTLSV